MAGIWDRIVPQSDPENDDRLGIHLLSAAVYLAAENVFTNTQIRDALNATLTVPLNAAAEADLLALVTLATAGSAAAQGKWLHLFESLGIAVEAGLLTNEVTYRTNLGL